MFERCVVFRHFSQRALFHPRCHSSTKLCANRTRAACCGRSYRSFTVDFSQVRLCFDSTLELPSRSLPDPSTLVRGVRMSPLPFSLGPSLLPLPVGRSPAGGSSHADAAWRARAADSAEGEGGEEGRTEGGGHSPSLGSPGVHLLLSPLAFACRPPGGRVRRRRWAARRGVLRARATSQPANAAGEWREWSTAWGGQPQSNREQSDNQPNPLVNMADPGHR